MSIPRLLPSTSMLWSENGMAGPRAYAHTKNRIEHTKNRIEHTKNRIEHTKNRMPSCANGEAAHHIKPSTIF